MGIELFERVAIGDGKLLSVSHRGVPGADDQVEVLALTFDLGRLVVRAEPSRAALSVVFVESSDAAPAGLTVAAEEEPWWRLCGCPLARVWPGSDVLAGGVCLQFRADEDNPRIVTLEPRGQNVVVRLENAPGPA